jgi:hypothetical protein
MTSYDRSKRGKTGSASYILDKGGRYYSLGKIQSRMISCVPINLAGDVRADTPRADRIAPNPIILVEPSSVLRDAQNAMLASGIRHTSNGSTDSSFTRYVDDVTAFLFLHDVNDLSDQARRSGEVDSDDSIPAIVGVGSSPCEGVHDTGIVDEDVDTVDGWEGRASSCYDFGWGLCSSKVDLVEGERVACRDRFWGRADVNAEHRGTRFKEELDSGETNA